MARPAGSCPLCKGKWPGIHWTGLPKLAEETLLEVIIEDKLLGYQGLLYTCSNVLSVNLSEKLNI